MVYYEFIELVSFTLDLNKQVLTSGNLMRSFEVQAPSPLINRKRSAIASAVVFLLNMLFIFSSIVVVRNA